MVQPATRVRVAEIVEDALAGCGLPSTLRQLIEIPLRESGKLLVDYDARWPRLVLASAQAARGSAATAPRVAAAVEIFMAGVDVLDEIEDADPSPLVDAAGIPQALNAAGILLMLGQRVLADVVVDDGGSPHLVHRLQRTLLDAAITAAGGQHLDLATEGRSDVSPEVALEIVRQKAGALMAGACRLGALLGTDDEAILALYETWGRHWGIAAQLSNDLQDAMAESGKSDRVRGKRTLPLVFAGRVADPSSPDIHPDALEQSGALDFTRVVIDVERQHAAAALAELAERGQDVAPLRELMGYDGHCGA